MFVQAYINTALELLKAYNGEEPFASYLKKYFSSNKKFGSRDRKHITHLCYCSFRLGRSLKDIDASEKLMIGLFLCSEHKNSLLEKINAGLNEEAVNSLEEKLHTIKSKYNFEVKDIFSFTQYLSDGIDLHNFLISFLIQPLTYLRIRPGHEFVVKEKLTSSSIVFQLLGENCLAIKPGEKLDGILELNREAVIQDYNSQKVLQPLMNHVGSRKISSAWDCCAASGGKSILLKDIFPQVEIMASDIRKSILINLEKRFQQAGIKNYRKLIADIGASALKSTEKFDLIICDAPCSGSGTWSRTPEQLSFFKESKIEEYSSLQKKITGNAIKNLKKGGLFLYITCSVFKKENEEVVKYIQEKLALELIDMRYLKGYEFKADTLFTALFSYNLDSDFVTNK